MNRSEGIINNWFKDHKAVLTQHGDLQVLQWKKSDSNMYSVRYVFDENKVYISGDLGEAIFWLTWKAGINTFNDVNIDYFAEKLVAYHGEKWSFNNKKMFKELREWLKGIKECDIEYNHDTMRELFEDARQCGSRSEWKGIVYEYFDFILELDPDCWEWLDDLGNEYPLRLQSYLIGLKMASEQLKVRGDKCAKEKD